MPLTQSCDEHSLKSALSSAGELTVVASCLPP